MALAYVTISVETGTDEKIMDELTKIEGITEVCLVYGIYDVVAKVEVESMGKLQEVITNIRRMNVRTTQTLIVYKSWYGSE